MNMVDVEIVLPCGFTTNYKNLTNQPNIAKCLMCNDHDINLQEVFNMPKNRLNIKLKEAEKLIEDVKQLKSKYQWFDSKYNNDNVINFELDRSTINSVADVNKRVSSLNVILDQIKQDVSDYDTLKTLGQEANFITQNMNQLTEDCKSKLSVSSWEFLNLDTCFDLDTQFAKKNNNVEILNIPKTANLEFECVSNFKCHDYNTSCIEIFDENRILTGSHDKIIKLLKKNDGTCLKIYKGHTNNVNCIAKLTSSLFASGSYDGTIKIWNVDSIKPIRTITEKIKSYCSYSYGKIWCLKLLSNGYLISGHEMAIKVWHYETGQMIYKFDELQCDIFCLTETLDGKIITGSKDCTLNIWDTNTREILRTIYGHHNDIICLKIIDEKRCASGSSDNTIRIWDIESGECLKILNGHTSKITCLDKMENNKLISGSWDYKIKIWDVDTGECINTIDNQFSSIYSLVTTQDDEIISGDNRGSIKIWKVKN